MVRPREDETRAVLGNKKPDGIASAGLVLINLLQSA